MPLQAKYINVNLFSLTAVWSLDYQLIIMIIIAIYIPVEITPTRANASEQGALHYNY